METLCTIIACGKYGDNCAGEVLVCQPLRDALSCADTLKVSGRFTVVRVYAETNAGTVLTLIYQPA